MNTRCVEVYLASKYKWLSLWQTLLWYNLFPVYGIAAYCWFVSFALVFLQGNHVLYLSFDTLDNVQLMEGDQQSNFSATVPGKVMHSKKYFLVFIFMKNNNLRTINFGPVGLLGTLLGMINFKEASCMW